MYMQSVTVYSCTSLTSSPKVTVFRLLLSGIPSIKISKTELKLFFVRGHANIWETQWQKQNSYMWQSDAATRMTIYVSALYILLESKLKPKLLGILNGGVDTPLLASCLNLWSPFSEFCLISLWMYPVKWRSSVQVYYILNTGIHNYVNNVLLK